MRIYRKLEENERYLVVSALDRIDLGSYPELESLLESITILVVREALCFSRRGFLVPTELLIPHSVVLRDGKRTRGAIAIPRAVLDDPDSLRFSLIHEALHVLYPRSSERSISSRVEHILGDPARLGPARILRLVSRRIPDERVLLVETPSRRFEKMLKLSAMLELFDKASEVRTIEMPRYIPRKRLRSFGRIRRYLERSARMAGLQEKIRLSLMLRILSFRKVKSAVL